MIHIGCVIGAVCIRLLEHFKFELSRFESMEIDRLCQSVVVCVWR